MRGYKSDEDGKELYRALKARIKQNKQKKSDLAFFLGLSPAALSQRLNGRTQWKIKEMYLTMMFCGIKFDKMHVFFPQNKNERK